MQVYLCRVKKWWTTPLKSCTYGSCVHLGPRGNLLCHRTCVPGSCICHLHSVSFPVRIFHSWVRPTGLCNPRAHHTASLLECSVLHRIENRRDTLKKIVSTSLNIPLTSDSHTHNMLSLWMDMSNREALIEYLPFCTVACS